MILGDAIYCTLYSLLALLLGIISSKDYLKYSKIGDVTLDTLAASACRLKARLGLKLGRLRRKFASAKWAMIAISSYTSTVGYNLATAFNHGTLAA